MPWLSRIIIKSADQIRPNSHQGIFSAVLNTVVFRMFQWKASISVITTLTLIMSMVVRIGGVPCTTPDMDCNSVQASPKVAERKNTQVTQISRKVSKA